MSKVFERDPGLSDLEFSMQETAHRFAKEVMRPIGQQLDRMDPEQAFVEGSPYWEARKKFCELGLQPCPSGRRDRSGWCCGTRSSPAVRWTIWEVPPKLSLRSQSRGRPT